MRKIPVIITIIAFLAATGSIYLLLSSREASKKHSVLTETSKEVLIQDAADIWHGVEHDPKISSDFFQEPVIDEIEVKDDTVEYDLDSEIEELLINLESKDINVMLKTSERLVSLGSRAVFALAKKLENLPLKSKGQAIFILGRIGDPEALPVLESMLNDSNAYIRRNAVEALGKIKDQKALAAVLVMLFDEDSGVRHCAAWALGELESAYAVDSLTGQLVYEKDEGAGIAIVNALGKIKDQRATEVLITELKADRDQVYKNEVVSALGDIGDIKALPELIEYIKILQSYKPEEAMFVYQLNEAIRITQEAIEKIKLKNNQK